MYSRLVHWKFPILLLLGCIFIVWFRFNETPCVKTPTELLEKLRIPHLTEFMTYFVWERLEYGFCMSYNLQLLAEMAAKDGESAQIKLKKVQNKTTCLSPIFELKTPQKTWILACSFSKIFTKTFIKTSDLHLSNIHKILTYAEVLLHKRVRFTPVIPYAVKLRCW